MRDQQDGQPAVRMIRKVLEFIFHYEVWFLVPITLLLYFPSPFMSIGFICAFGLSVCRWIILGNPIPATNANLAILILLAMTAIGFAISPAPDLSVITAGQIIASTTIFWVLLDKIHSSSALWSAAAVLAIIGMLFALVSPFTVVLSPDKVYNLPIIYDYAWPKLPESLNANIVAGALAAIVLIALALILNPRYHFRILGAVSLAPLLAMLIVLQSRGALFALGVGLATWVSLYRRWALPLILIAFMGALFLNYVLEGPAPAQFVYGRIGTPTGGTLIERQEMWIQALYLIQQSPFVGIGLNAYPRVAPYVWPYSPSQPGMVFKNAHNLFLQIALDTGLLGLGAFVVLLLLTIRSAWRAYRRGVERHLAAGVLAAFVVLITHGFVETIVWGTESSIVLWILFGIATSFDRIQDVV